MKKYFLFLAALVAFFVSVPAYGGIYVSPQQQEQDSSGFSLGGGKLYFYEPGTTTAKTVYQDKDFATAHSNPVVADSAGRFDPIYLDGAYKIVLTDTDDVTIWTEDNITAGSDSVFSETESVTSSGNIDATYDKKHVRATGNITLSLLAISTAGEGFSFSIRNDGTGVVTLDPNASEEINDTTTWSIPPGGSGILIAGTSEWSFIGSMGVVQSLASGDILYLDANKQLARLEKGAQNDFLLQGASFPEWGSTLAGDYSYTGKVLVPDDGELTISSGSITPTGVNHTVDTESDASSDDLTTISGGSDGQSLEIRIEDDSRNVVIKTTDNIVTPDGEDITLDTTNQSVTLLYDGALTKWIIRSSTALLNYSAAGAFGGKLLHVQHQEASGTGGGTSQTSWTTRDLTTELTNEISGGGLVFEMAYDAQTANFTVGGTVTGGTSGATATIVADNDGGTTGTLKIIRITGTFQNNETITDGGGGSATSDIASGVVDADQVYLPAGTYHAEAYSIGYDCSLHKAKLYNASDTSDILIGSNVLSDTSNPSMSPSHISGRFTLAAGKLLEIQHIAGVSVAEGFGRDGSFSVVEVYADLKVWQVR